MDTITEQEFWKLCQGATILEQGLTLPKVLETAEEQIIKVFRVRRRISKNSFYPPSKRFLVNAKRLAKKKIASVDVRKFYTCPELNIHVIVYQKINGEDLRQSVRQGNLELLTLLATYLAHLHSQGIFFRGIHLANLICTDDGFSIIDMSDLKIRARKLGLPSIIRNMLHLLKDPDDLQSFQQYGIETFIKQYLKSAQVSALNKKFLRYYLNKKLQNHYTAHS